MRGTFSMGLLLLLFLSSASSTPLAAESSVVPINLFVLPAPTLRPVADHPLPHLIQLPPLNEESDTEEKIILQVSTISAEAQQQLYEGLNGPIIFQVDLPGDSAGALGWLQSNLLDPILVPSVIKVGKVYVTGSIITAVQRRNPLSLLNPLVLAIDW